MDNGVYKHLVWNYDDLVHMYKDNTAGSRYFCESLFWAAQASSKNLTRPLMPSAPQTSCVRATSPRPL